MHTYCTLLIWQWRQQEHQNTCNNLHHNMVSHPRKSKVLTVTTVRTSNHTLSLQDFHSHTNGPAWLYEDWVHWMCPSKSSEISINFHMIWNSTIRWKNFPIWAHLEDSQIQIGDTTIILDIVIKKNIQVHQPETNPIHAASSQLFPDPWCKSKNAYKILSVPLFLPALKGACSGLWQVHYGKEWRVCMHYNKILVTVKQTCPSHNDNCNHCPATSSHTPLTFHYAHSTGWVYGCIYYLKNIL